MLELITLESTSYRRVLAFALILHFILLTISYA